MAHKLRILFLAAHPVDTFYRLRLDEEAREIDEKIQGGSKRELFEVVAQWAVRPSDLQKALLRHDPHIVHFSGHCKENEGITLEDQYGNMKPVSKQALIGLFRILKDNIKVVLLNACHSRHQADAIREVIDFTIAMKTTIGDKASVIFASYFYQALAFGRSVREAFELAKNELEIEGIDYAKTPELLERKGVDASKAYLIKKTGVDRAHKDGEKKSGKSGKAGAVIASGNLSLAAELVKGSTVIFGDRNKVSRK